MVGPLDAGDDSSMNPNLDDDSAAAAADEDPYVVRRWPGGRMIYEVGPGVPADCEQVILAAMEHISEDTCVTFERRTTQTGGWVSWGWVSLGGSISGWISGLGSGSISGWISGSVSGSISGWISGLGSGSISGWISGSVSGSISGWISGSVSGSIGRWVSGWVGGGAERSICTPRTGKLMRFNLAATC